MKQLSHAASSAMSGLVSAQRYVLVLSGVSLAAQYTHSSGNLLRDIVFVTVFVATTTSLFSTTSVYLFFVLVVQALCLFVT